MNFWQILGIAIWLGSFQVNTVFGNSRFSWTLPHFAESGQANICESKLAQLAQRFESETELRVVAKGCFADNAQSPSLNGVIYYKAEEAIKYFSLYESAFDELQYMGMYASKSECLADLEEQGRQFREATGLPVFASYCWLQSNGNQPTYGINIIALGRTHIRFFARGIDALGTLAGMQPDEIKQQIFDRAYNLPMALARNYINQDPFYLQLRIGFYASYELFLHHHAGVEYESSTYCLNDVTAAASAFYQANPAHLVVFCSGTNALNKPKLNILSISRRRNENDTYDYKVLGDIFIQRSTCEQDLAKQKSRLQELGFDPYLLLCGQTRERKYKIHVFMNR